MGENNANGNDNGNDNDNGNGGNQTEPLLNLADKDEIITELQDRSRKLKRTANFTFATIVVLLVSGGYLVFAADQFFKADLLADLNVNPAKGPLKEIKQALPNLNNKTGELVVSLKTIQANLKALEQGPAFTAGPSKEAILKKKSNVDYARVKLLDLRRKNDQAQKKVETLRQQIQDLKEREIEKKKTDSYSEIMQKIIRNKEDIEEKRNSTVKRNEQTKNEIKRLSPALDSDIIERLTILEKERRSNENEIRGFDRALENLGEKLGMFSPKHKAVEGELEKIASKMKFVKGELDKAEKDADELHTRVAKTEVFVADEEAAFAFALDEQFRLEKQAAAENSRRERTFGGLRRSAQAIQGATAGLLSKIDSLRGLIGNGEAILGTIEARADQD